MVAATQEASARWHAAEDQAIGRFFRNFSELEDVLRWVVAVRLGILEKDGEAILGLLDYGALCSAVYSVLLLDRDQQPDKLNKFIKRCRKMGHKRNRIAHANWYSPGGITHIDRNTVKPQLVFEDPTQLNKWSEEAKDLALEALL